MNIFKVVREWIVFQWERHSDRVQQAQEYRATKRELAKVGKRPGAYMGYTPTATWLRRAIYKRFGWSLTTQNLNHDRNGWYGAMLRHGRAWINRHGEDDYRGWGLHVEWGFLQKSGTFRLGFSTGGEERGVGFSIGFGRYLSLYINIERVLRKYSEGREWGITVNEDHVSLRYGGDPWDDKWNGKKRYMSFFWKDKVFGRAKYDKQVVKEERTIIPMPEGPYPATVRIDRASWKRPRALFPRVVYKAEITPDTPVGIPGKGENSYDIEDDATYSMSTPASTVPEAVSAFVESILERRERYGGKGWVPEAVAK